MVRRGNVAGIAFDPSRVVLAGHSMGGLVAIQLTLMGAPNVRGFVAIGPAVPFLDAPEELEAVLIPARQRGVRGYFTVGAKDNAIFADKIHALSEKLQSAGIVCELETIPDATHDYSPAYDAALLRALVFMDASR
jgi:pimeloyl-ACP methyl ester carboxylesterase